MELFGTQMRPKHVCNQVYQETDKCNQQQCQSLVFYLTTTS